MSIFSPRNPLNSLEDSIVAFEKEPVVTGKILFYGDSRFTRWNARYGNIPLEEALLGSDGKQAVVNHGFGTSMMDELLYYYHRAVLPWRPRALVVAAGGNDLWRGYSDWEYMFLLERLLEYARLDMPGIRLYLVGMSMSLKHADDVETSYTHLRARINRAMEEYCEEHDDTVLLKTDDYPGFFNSAADVGDFHKVRRDIFIEDKVHFNPQGYAIYRDFFREKLADIL